MKISKRTILCSHNDKDWYNRELAYRKNNYLRAKRAFETLSEDDNNDVLTLEDKMLAAKADYENFKRDANKHNDVNCGKRVNKRYVRAAESYKDIHGVMGTPGDIWTSAELRKYWKDEHMNDPVMSEYDSVDSWFRDTVSQMEPVNTSTSINAAELDYSTPELKKLRKAIQSIVVDNDAEFVQLVDDMINNTTINYVPETRALKRCIDNMLEYDSEREVRNWVLKYAADLGCIDSDNINSASTCVNAATDVDTERYLHSLVGEVESALANEVDSVNFEQDNNNLYVTITYMSVTQEYAFGFSELTMLWDSIDEDTSYIVNTILQGLDRLRYYG